jgi:hypothetical protein
MSIRNLTPHTICIFPSFATAGDTYRTNEGWGCNLGYSTIASSGQARVSESRSERSLLSYPSVEDFHDGNGPTEYSRAIPVRTVTYGEVTGLPDWAPDTYYIVSLLVVQVARAHGRRVDDLLTPGDLVRSPSGEIAGCTSFFRW